MDVIIYLFDFILSLQIFSFGTIIIGLIVLAISVFFAFKLIDMLT